MTFRNSRTLPASYGQQGLAGQLSQSLIRPFFSGQIFELRIKIQPATGYHLAGFRTERCQGDRTDGQSIIQVPSEFALFDLFKQVTIARGDDGGPAFNFLASADLAEGLFLKDTGSLACSSAAFH